MEEVRDLLVPTRNTTLYEAIHVEMDKYWNVPRQGDYITRLRALSSKRGRNTLLSELLQECDDNGDTPLRLACAMGNVAIVRLLLALGADVEDAGAWPGSWL